MTTLRDKFPHDCGDILVCQDCYLAHHFGEASEDPDYVVTDNTCTNHYYGQDVGNWQDAANSGTVCDQCGQASADDGLYEVKWQSCDGCGSHLGGARYRMHVWGAGGQGSRDDDNLR